MKPLTSTNPGSGPNFGAALLTLGLCLLDAQFALAGAPCQPAHVTASDPGFFELFGTSVAVRGNLALVGATQDSQPVLNAGAVYVLERQPSGWTHLQKLRASDAGQDDGFGRAVCISEDTAFVGTFNHLHPGAPGSGAVYIYRLVGTSWVQVQELPRPDALAGAFGRALALSGPIAVVGAWGDDALGVNAGAAFIFRYNIMTGQWTQEQKLLASDGQANSFFGDSVDIEGDVALIGSSADDHIASNAGSAYIFRRNPQIGQWIQEQKLLASDAGIGNEFGKSVSLSGDTALIGARGNGLRGAAYVFRFNGRNWVQTQKLTPSDTWADQFGYSVSIDGDRAVVGTPASQPYGGFQPYGAAYVYRFDTDTEKWVLHMPALLPEHGPTAGNFGWSAAIDGSTVIVGAPNESAPFGQSGGAYIYDVDPHPADLNCDGVINTLDLGILLSGWSIPPKALGCAGDTPCPADINGDGYVNTLDLGVLLSSWTL